MFKGLSLDEFNNFFRTESDCREYLFNLKWKKGFRCRRCACDKFRKGRTSFHARCSSCSYDESITAHTIFHKIQLPLRKAFAMAFHIAVFKKGISSVQLATAFSINQKTAWTFKRRVQQAMGAGVSGGKRKGSIKKITKLDSIIIMHRGDYLNGLQKLKMTVKSTDKSCPSKGMIFCITKLPNARSMSACELEYGHYVREAKDITMWNFKTWLTGIHHHCSDKHLQAYSDEYFFRLNWRSRREKIFHELLRRIVSTKPGNL